MRPALPLTAVASLVGFGVADAAPVAQLARDLDGDGSPDTIVLEAGGKLDIQTRRGTSTLALGTGIQRATITVAQHAGASLVVVDTGTHAIVIGQSRGRWVELARTPIGGVGIDADYSIAVDATPQGIYRYQTRAGGHRCDGKPAYLFAEGWNGSKFQRLSKLPVGVPDSAPVIAARLDPGPAPEALLYKARFASHQVGASDAGALGIPAELDDGKPSTVWREDLAGSSGEGQFFTYVPRFPEARATQIRIVHAAQKGLNRPQRLGVVSKSGAWHVELPDPQKDPAGSAYVADLPAPIEGCVTIVIESTWGPDKGTTQIAELAVYADGERSGNGGEAALARAIADGKDGSRLAAQALARRGASAVTALETELAQASDGARRARLVRALMSVRDPAAGPVLARVVSQGIVQGSDLVAAIGALAGLGQAQELHDLAARSGLATDARIAAVRALSPATDRERELLGALAGRGPRRIRHAVIEQMMQVPVSVLVPLAEQATEPAAAGDLWRAVTRRVHVVADERSTALAAMTAALPSATDYERRYRLVDGIAATGDDAALKSLSALLAKLPADAETAAYKQIAARAIGTNPRPEATDVLVPLARDPDPGVRLSVLWALTGATGTGAGAWHGNAGPDGIDRVIMTVLATDAWPEVRRSAAQVLGSRCMRPGPAQALVAAVTRDADLYVRGDALAGLVQCKASGVAELLAKLWDDGKAPIELRQRAVDLAVTLGDPALAARLPGKLTQWRGAAIESAAALALAQNAAYAVGRLGPPGAADALVAALEDAAFPEIVAAAATGLGLLGAKCPPAAQARLRVLARGSEEQQVQTAARRAAGVCGK